MQMRGRPAGLTPLVGVTQPGCGGGPEPGLRLAIANKAQRSAPRDQGRGGTHLLSSSSWLDRSAFSFRTLSTSSRARCSFSSASATYWAPSKGRDGVSLLPEPGSRWQRPLPPPPRPCQLARHRPWAKLRGRRARLSAGHGRGQPLAHRSPIPSMSLNTSGSKTPLSAKGLCDSLALMIPALEGGVSQAPNGDGDPGRISHAGDEHLHQGRGNTGQQETQGYGRGLASPKSSTRSYLRARSGTWTVVDKKRVDEYIQTK